MNVIYLCGFLVTLVCVFFINTLKFIKFLVSIKICIVTFRNTIKQTPDLHHP